MPERLDFKAIAEGVDIEAVARHLDLTLSKDGRSECPACNSKDRALEIIAETNTFRCWAAPVPAGKKCLGGDNIALVAHVRGYGEKGQYRAATELADTFDVGRVSSTGTSSTYREDHATAPQPEKREPTRQQFDPEEYAAKLQYSDAVSSLGISAETAERLKIGQSSSGIYRGMVAFPIRDDAGQIVDFIGYDPETGTLKVPKHWAESKVVPLLKRPA